MDRPIVKVFMGWESAGGALFVPRVTADLREKKDS